MGYFAALAITLFLAAFVRITAVNGGVQMVIYFPCTHGKKSVLSLGTQHHKTQQKLVETISFNELLSALFLGCKFQCRASHRAISVSAWP